ncbi:ATP-binding protein [Xylanimonas oleitrophica]|uniref:ATP-binding protein n=1 Tax=Xylanimonas oleitrophica TaxID=2607479 RepID=A0A2W5WRW8_9MICO|nr:ATP-binding protein [Xylanimonas oleitrophica]PZR53860.1 ATP-binding protein [Xylanimonas oleitrophica]
MITEVLPDIPRAYTAVAEWAACMTYVLLVRGPVRGRRSPVLVGAVSVAGLGVLLAVQEAAGRLPISLWTLGMGVAVAVMFACIRLSTDVSLRDAGYLTARAFVLAELVASLHWQLHSYFLAPAGSPSPVVEGVLLVGVEGAAFTVAYLLERRHFEAGRPPEVDLRSLAGAVAIAAATFFMSNLSFVSANTPFSGRPGREVFYIRTLVDLAGYVALYAQQGHRREVQRATEVEAMRRMLVSQHEQYLRSKRSIDVVNRKYHDMKHYVAAIRAETDPVAKASYLDQLEESISGYGVQAQTGNAVLDTIITAKTAECGERGITLTSVVDGTALSFMSPMDLSALFGNALDNAVESVSALPSPEKRLIRVAVYTQDMLVLVRFENYHEGELEMEDGLPRTTKADRTHHGYGLRNMRQVAERYGGSLTVRAEDGWFVVRVLFPVPAAGAQQRG